MGYPRFLTHQNSLRPRAIADCPSHLVSSSVLSSLHGLNFFLETHFDVPPRSIPCFPSPPPLFRSVEGLNWYSILYSLPLRIFVGWLSQRGSLSIISSLHGFNYCSDHGRMVLLPVPTGPPERREKQGSPRGLQFFGTTCLADVPSRSSPCFPSFASLFRSSEGLWWKWTVISMNEKVSNNGNFCNYWTSGKGKGFL